MSKTKVQPNQDLETTSAEQTPEHSPETLDYVKDKLEAFLGESIDTPVEETKQDESAEDTQEETEPVKPAVESKPDFDLNKYKEDVKQEVSQEVTDKILEALTGKNEDQQGEKSPWDQEGRNPKDWNEIIGWTKELAKTELKKEIEEASAYQQEQEQKEARYIEDETQKFNNYIDNQLEDLRVQGKLPKIQNAKDSNDEGLKAQKEFFQQMYETNEKRAKEGAPLISDVKIFYYEHFKPTSKQNRGSEAPVLGGRRSIQHENKGEYSYDEIHNSSYYDLIGK